MPELITDSVDLIEISNKTNETSLENRFDILNRDDSKIQKRCCRFDYEDKQRLGYVAISFMVAIAVALILYFAFDCLDKD